MQYSNGRVVRQKPEHVSYACGAYRLHPPGGPVWEALQRLSTVIGEVAVATMLRTLSPTEQHGVALGFIMREQREVAAAKPVSPGETPRKEYLKLRVSNYMGREGETLLRWLVELDTAVVARRLVDPLAKVAFAMFCLGGRARSWAYGRRLTDPTCFLQGGAQTRV
ncbi:hypothetical protein PHMEG_00011729 [Phytophthora megakarya]|uniref:Uncharacterized protein n=1 Tax=Phytophthora megakarya TaxID=4795 RepID=A0A225WBZ5_9STRA|nr:hypothetical protein PHMEG_00011729 [Phytophthora megakarya]